MGWGTEFKADIYLSRQSYATKNAVEDRIDEIDHIINDYESELKMFASATPKDIIPSDESQINWLNVRINEILEIYQEHIVERYKLTLYLDYLNEGGEIVKAE